MAIDTYKMVTDRIIEQLKKGVVPWHKPWVGLSGAVSHVTGKPYELINQFLLGEPGEYLTFKRVQEEGGHVKKGEKAKIIIFFKTIVKDRIDKNGELVQDVIPIPRYYNVFRVDQCEGIKPKYDVELPKPANPIERGEEIITDYVNRSGVTLEHSMQDRAYYRPATDTISLPQREQFPQIEEYYSTAFHEMVHSTGHKSRLNRSDKVAGFGTKTYSKEELVAEIGSATLMNHAGIETEGTFDNSAAYINSWLKQLESDVRFVVQAARHAQKAVNMILGIKDDTESV